MLRSSPLVYRLGWPSAVFVALFVAACGEDPATPQATIVVTDARIWTGDEAMPWAEALAADGDTIVAVGSRADVEPYVGPATNVVSIPGSMLVPGMIDSHVHFSTGGAGLASVQLRDAASADEFTRRIAEFADGIEPGEWILNGTWDHENWGGELPQRAWTAFREKRPGQSPELYIRSRESGDQRSQSRQRPG
jgi:predicted amidohydrolase YtcJ